MKKIGVCLFIFVLFTVPVYSIVIETIDAIVNGELILSGEVDDLIRVKYPGENFSQWSAERLTQERAKILQELIDELLIIQEVRSQLTKEQRNIIVQLVEKQTNEVMAKYRNQFTSPEELAQFEKKNGMSLEEMHQIQRRINERLYLRRYMAPRITRRKVTPPTAEEIEEFKRQYPDVTPSGKITISQIFLRVPSGASSAERERILELANQIVMRARGGEPFEELVVRYSDHEESKKYGGRLGEFSKDETLKEFAPVFEQDENEISEPIRTASGYHIIKVLKKDTLEDYILMQKWEKETIAWVKELRKKAEIEYPQGIDLKLSTP